jgi:hypothetical protein
MRKTVNDLGEGKIWSYPTIDLHFEPVQKPNLASAVILRLPKQTISLVGLQRIASNDQTYHQCLYDEIIWQFSVEILRRAFWADIAPSPRSYRSAKENEELIQVLN